MNSDSHSWPVFVLIYDQQRRGQLQVNGLSAAVLPSSPGGKSEFFFFFVEAFFFFIVEAFFFFFNWASLNLFINKMLTEKEAAG